MIRFSLHCDEAHAFEAWFRSNDDYEAQCRQALVSCPVCGSTAISKMLMTPALSTAHRRKPAATDPGQVERRLLEQLQQVSRHIRANASYVGNRFAEEARRIHFGETAPRAIYGEADAGQVTSLLQDGIDVLPLPPLPEEQN